MEQFLSVTPQQVLIGDPIDIRVSGLSYAQEASIVVSGKDQFGNFWSSQATYQADAAGTIDPARNAPVSGTYRGVDKIGLFWSMVHNPADQRVSPFVVMDSVNISLIVNGQEKGKQIVKRIANLDLDKTEIADEIIGVFFKPREITQPTAALIVLGGSEGGYNQGWAAVTASKTRMPVLALGYFGAKGLPPTLENIPIEVLEKAMNWLARQPSVMPDRFGLVGVSRGGEMALLAASVFPKILAVVAYTPSGVLWEGLGATQKPAWTYQGKPFPYLLMMNDENSQRYFLDAQKKGTEYSATPLFLNSLKMQENKISEAAIPVEKSRAAFLLIGSEEDGIWPSQMLSQISIDRLHANKYPRYFELLSYKEAGHMLTPFPYYPTTLRKYYLPAIKVWIGPGGTAKGAANAASDSWPKVVKFLHRELRDK